MKQESFSVHEQAPLVRDITPNSEAQNNKDVQVKQETRALPPEGGMERTMGEQLDCLQKIFAEREI